MKATVVVFADIVLAVGFSIVILGMGWFCVRVAVAETAPLLPVTVIVAVLAEAPVLACLYIVKVLLVMVIGLLTQVAEVLAVNPVTFPVILIV